MENQSLLAYLQRSLAMVMNEVTLNQAPTSNSLFAGDSEFAISLLVDSIERVLQHGRKSKFFGDPVSWDVFGEFGRRPWASVYLGTANANGDSDIERGRIFLRFLLQHQLLVVFADELSQNEDIIEEYYEPNAIMARSDDYAIFRQQLVSLELLPLKFPGAPARQQPTQAPIQAAPSSPPPKKVEQPTPAHNEPPPPSPTPVVVTAGSKKKKTVNRIISFDTESTDSTVKKVAKRPTSSTHSGTSSLENSTLSASTDDLSLSTSVEVAPSQPTQEEPPVPVQPVEAAHPVAVETPVEVAKNGPEPSSTFTVPEPEPIAPEVEKDVETVSAAAEPLIAAPEPQTISQDVENIQTQPIEAEQVTLTPSDASTTTDATDSQQRLELPVENDTNVDDVDDTGDGPLQLHVRHDDDHDSLDSASEDEEDYPEPSSVNATVDSTIEGVDDSKQTDDEPEIDTVVPSADLSKLLAGFAASFSDNQ